MDYTVLDGANFLIIGGAGFVGGNLTRMIVDMCPNAHITIVDNLLSSERATICSSLNIRFIEGSITDARILAALTDEFDYVFHLATFHGNQSSIHDPIRDHDNNVLTTLLLYERLKNFRRLKKVVYSSAGCSVAKKTFDMATPTSESDAIELHQDSPYSISKIIGEFYSVYYHKQHRLPVVRARFQNVYGPGEILGAGQWRGTPATVWRNVTPTFIYKSLCNEALPLQNGGIATRDFIYVEDICRGLLCCAVKGEPGDVYNLGTGQETSIAELASLINELTGNSTPVKHLPRRPWDNSGKRFADISKSERILKFCAQTDIRTGLSRTVEWTKKNRTFIEACIQKHEGHMKNWKEDK